MAWVYPAYQHLMTDSGNINLAGHAALKARPILITTAFAYLETDVTVADVRANGGSPLAFSATGTTNYHGVTDNAAEGEILQNVVTTIVTNGVEVRCDKRNFPLIATEAAWDKMLIYDATSDATEVARIAICVVEIANITPNGSGIDVSFDAGDPGAFMTSESI